MSLALTVVLGYRHRSVQRDWVDNGEYCIHTQLLDIVLSLTVRRVGFCVQSNVVFGAWTFGQGSRQRGLGIAGSHVHVALAAPLSTADFRESGLEVRQRGI